MNDKIASSPKMQKHKAASTNNLHRINKSTKPSRYANELSPNKSGNQDILNSAESAIKMRLADSGSPIKRQKQKIILNDQPSVFRPKPMKRNESEFEKFKEVFVDPKKEVLNQLHHQAKASNFLHAKKICKDYEKVLNFQNGDPIKDKNEEIKDTELTNHIQECIEILEDNHATVSTELENVYDQQIKMEPPESSTGTTSGSRISLGVAYAPSVPLNLEQAAKEKKLRELLMISKSGAMVEDIEKEAHLSFYLGSIYQQRQIFPKAVKFYRRFLTYAKSMEDKIGMTMGANLVAVNLYYSGETQRSIAFHQQNLKLSDEDNCFAGNYNLGICYRRLANYDEAIKYFEVALEWCIHNGDIESECLSLGQLALTYKCIEQHQVSLEYFEKSVKLCRKLKNNKLREANLLNILLITSKFSLKSKQSLSELTKEAYQCSKALNENRYQQIFACNMGAVEGRQKFIQWKNRNTMEPECQQLQAQTQVQTQKHSQQLPIQPHSKNKNKSGSHKDSGEIMQDC